MNRKYDYNKTQAENAYADFLEFFQEMQSESFMKKIAELSESDRIRALKIQQALYYFHQLYLTHQDSFRLYQQTLSTLSENIAEIIQTYMLPLPPEVRVFTPITQDFQSEVLQLKVIYTEEITMAFLRPLLRIARELNDLLDSQANLPDPETLYIKPVIVSTN